jgi:phosphate transport system permease protein
MTTVQPPGRSLEGGSGGAADRLFRNGTRVAGSFLVIALIAIGVMLWLSSSQAFGTFGLGFVTGLTWDPVASIYGALPYVVGTILTSLIAVIVAAPIGVLTAIFLAELAPRRLSVPLTFMIELLAAIPSVVFGLWGVFVLGPFLGHTIEAWAVEHLGWIPIFAGPAYGIGLFTAGMILAIMIVPTIVSISREVISSVPASQREAMAALGATRWEIVTKAVLPYARSGIVGAIILGLGRALGETMAVTMVIGNNPQISPSLFAPQYTMSAVIANEFTEASDALYLSALVEIGLVLFIITLLVNGLSRALIWSMARQMPSKAAA